MKIYNDYKKIEKVLDGITIDQYKKTLNLFEDELSKTLYYYRIMADNNKDNNPYYGLMLCKTALENHTFKKYDEIITYRLICFLLKNNNYKKKIYVIGYTYWGTSVRTIIWQTFDGIEIEELFDENPNTYDYYGKAITPKPISELKNRKFDSDSCFIVGNPKYEYLLKDLPKNTFFIDSEYTVFDFGTQYFEETICPFNDHEVFVDGGAYLLENTVQFMHYTNNRYKHIYAFEPDSTVYNYDLKMIEEKKWNNLTMLNFALMDKEGEMTFSDDVFADSRYDKNGKNICKCNSMDNLLLDKGVSVIKLDIEGAERDALIGAEKIIKQNKPKLIICVYHKPNDVVDLINLIMGMRDDYKVYLRHYGTCIYETVAYFV